MKLFELIANLPDELAQALERQTKAAINTTDDRGFKYIKFIYKESIVKASSVLTEYHIATDIKATGREVRQLLREALVDAPDRAPINISFAVRPLHDDQTLLDIGAIYGDKVYFNVGDPRGGKLGPSGLPEWTDYFKQVSLAIQRDPSLYEDIVKSACERLEAASDIVSWAEEDWKLLLLARNFPELYVSMTSGRSILRQTRRLIDTLEAALNKRSSAAIYHTANILEWLAFLKPRMFEGVDLKEGRETREKLATSLLRAVDPTENLPGRVRMETAWAISWASVASQEFGGLVYEKLIEYAEAESSAPIATTLRGAALRSFLYPTPYFLAAISQKAGWFEASVLDHHQFRRIAIAGQHDDALNHFRSKLDSVLPRGE